MKTVWHVSPENFSVPRFKYHRAFGEKVFFVSPTYKSLIRDWMPYVFNKKKIKKYSHLYVYCMQISNYTYQYCNIMMDHGIQNEKSESRLFGFWCWGAQLAIPEHLRKDITIINKKGITYGQFLDMIARNWNSEWETWYNKKESK